MTTLFFRDERFLSLLDLFNHHVKHTPDADAVSHQTEQLTYRELDQRANRLAHQLVQTGVRPEVHVGVCVDRTPDLIVALLAIWKAGGAYVPLDPHYPQDRLSYILQDSGVQIVLSHSRWASKIRTATCPTIWLDQDKESLDSLAAEEQRDPQPDDLAYIMYTSGSTGRPKGVMIEHRGLLHMVAAQIEHLHVGPGTRVLQFFSPSFDTALYEIVSAIMTGGTLVLAERESLLPSPELVELLREQRINVLTISPSALSLLPVSELPDLHTLAVGAEACPPQLAQRWGKGRRFLNLYGPTEVTIWSTVHLCTLDEERPPIGKPLAHLTAQVLDAEGKSVAEGAPGELYIGGIGLARGYLNNPQQTAEKFIVTQSGERFYRTGDLVRVLPDGAIDFIGRIDQQVKIRGYRVELGEIRTALAQHASVRDAVVLYHDKDEQKRLVAYLIADGAELPANRQLRDFLKNTLPDYMIPTSYLWLDRFPTTPNGKVDLQALPEFARQQQQNQGNPHNQPRSSVTARPPMEETLAEIWTDVLGVDDVREDDHFFEIGGHSLLATLVVSRVQERLHKDVRIRSLYDTPHFQAWCQQVRAASFHTSKTQQLVPRTTDIIPLSSPQKRMWFFEQLHPEQVVHNLPMAFRLRGQLDVQALEKSLQEMVTLHHVLRTRFVEKAGEPQPVVAPPEEWTCAIRTTDDEDALLQAEALKPFDLARELPFRCTLVQRSEQEWMLLLTFHHIVMDGWSMDTFFEELGNWYFLFTGGRGLVPTEPLYQYGDFALWQEAWLNSEVYQRQLAYWVEQLHGAPEELELPHDRPRPLEQTYRGGKWPLSLTAAQVQSLWTLGRSEGASLYMVLMAALQTLLHLCSGQRDIIVGTPIANRNLAEFERLIGFFVNTLAIRATFADNPSFKDVLKQIRQTVLDAYEHQDAPFEKVVEKVGVRRSVRHTPLFQVMLVLHNQRNIGLQLPGLDVYQLETDTSTTMFDLIFELTETPEGCEGWVRYNADLFDETTVERWIGQFLHILETVSVSPEQGIEELQGTGAAYSPRPRTVASQARKVTAISYTQSTGLASEVERKLASIWEEQVGRIGIEHHDNFFEVGGHSLMAVKIMSRVREVFAVDLPLKAFFANPTIAGLAQVVETTQTTASPMPISAILDETCTPISLSQQRLWYIDHFETGGSAYNMAFRVRLSGSLQAELLEASIREIVRRHEMLRTVFLKDEGDSQVHQVVLPDVQVVLHRVDLSLMAQTEAEKKWKALIRDEAGVRFDLENGPLTRFTLVKDDETEHVLIFVVHHIVFDGWSLDVFIQELVSLYESLAQGKPSALPELPIQYKQFAQWQRQWLRSPVVQEQVAYWREKLAGAPALLDLPTDRPRPAAQSFRGHSFEFKLPETLLPRLQQLGRQHKVSLFTVLLAAYQILLSRTANADEILVGTPVAGRNREETEPLIGFFVNTLVIRTRCAAQTTFAELLAQVQETVVEALSHQDVPFDKIVEEVRPERNLSYNPLFQAMFILQEFSVDTQHVQGLAVSAAGLENETSQFDVTLSVENRENTLVGTLGYSTDLFDLATMERMAGHYAELLQSIVENAEQPLGELQLLTMAEREWFEEVNQTRKPLTDRTVQELFAARAAEHPERIALTYLDRTLTYRELDRAANQLAHHLLAKGVQRETLVGISVERSPEMLIALLGVLKAGAAYVPLDPALPEERIAYMMENAQLAYLVTTTYEVPLIAGSQPEVVHLFDPQSEWRSYPTEAPEQASRPDDLAYVLFTSGSTGRPKGVQIEQRALVNLLESVQDLLQLRAQDVWLAVTTLSFDISMLELLLPLITGAQVNIAPTHVAFDGGALATLLSTSRATVIQATPVTYRLLLEAGWSGSPDLNVLCGGEALPAALAEQLLTRCGSLWNMYGPTETTIWSATSRVQPGEAITIGTPLANTQLYVLDARQQPVPIGVPGELYIGGDGLARGYLHQPELTHEKFVPDPFKSGRRMYRTGDLVRYLPDGRLQFIQRVDNQVKVRGYRIELGEIETVLTRHEAISQAVVMITESTAGEPELAAYLIAQSETPPSTWELREYLNSFLPTYMVPAVFGWVQEFPLTPSGKVDRKKLLDVPLDKALKRPEYRSAPRDPMEKELVVIWEAVLNYHPIGIHDSFFELGGHSLLMVQLINRIKKCFHHEVPMLFFMQNPTVEALACLLRKEIEFQRPDHALVPLQPKGEQLPLYVTHAVSGNVYSYTELIRFLGEEQPVYGLQMVHFDPQKAPRTLYDMASGYIDEMLEQQPQGPFVLGGHSFGGNLAYEMAVQLHERGHDVQRLLLFDTALTVQKPDRPLDDEALEVMYLQRFDRQEKTKHLMVSPDELLAMPREKRLAYLLQLTKMNGFVPPDAEIPELLNALNAWSINVRALMEYEPRTAPIPITFFLAESSEPDMVQEWEAITSRTVDVKVVTGTHFTMMRTPHVLQVLEPIQAIMKAVEGRQETR